MREYANELRTKKEVHNVFIRGCGDGILNALEFLHFRAEKDKSTGCLVRERHGTANILGVSLLKKHIMECFYYSDKGVERVFELFEKGKRAIEFIEEESDKRIQSAREKSGDFEKLRSGFYHRRLNLPKGCTCVMYCLDIGRKIGREACKFWLMRAPHGFTLALWLPNSRSGDDNLTVLSDVPTIIWGEYNSLCSSNEILSTSTREFMWDNFFASSNYIKSKGWKLGARFFIRQGYRADEIELNGENAAPDKCGYFVQMDPFWQRNNRHL
jgi:hypothetical protein